MSQTAVYSHPIFSSFEKWAGESDGVYIRDFLGVKTDPVVNVAWKAHPSGKNLAPHYPVANEHYYDWLVVLSSVLEAKDQFTMLELGAGWAPWLVRAAYALKQSNPDIPFLLVGVEGDETHYQWMVEHFKANTISPEEHLLVDALVSDKDGIAYFPKLNDPAKDYGASITNKYDKVQAQRGELIEAKTISLDTLLAKIPHNIDLIHMDIQGEEEKVLNSSIELISKRVKKMLIGTHRSSTLHENVRQLMWQHNWLPKYNFDRNSKWATEWGTIQFNDGFQCWINPSLTNNA
jgi:FkbM family methyltransferase